MHLQISIPISKAVNMWILIRTYGNGAWMNYVYPMVYHRLDKALDKCKELNEKEIDKSQKWIAIRLFDQETVFTD